ncbi:hypothetical protein ACSKF1_05745 [Lactiplantibacillus plantarum]|uniref:hypothetical protein n=1 Tax=Lactiplantibacillus plantarum TaxID=1590 RepID=UPI003F65513B
MDNKITSKQFKILKQIKDNQYSTDVDYYNLDPALNDLVKRKLIQLQLNFENNEFIIKRYIINPTGSNAYDFYLDSKAQIRRTSIWYPILVSSVSGVIGAGIGALATYLRMK